MRSRWSQANPLSVNVGEKLRIGIRVRMPPLLFPEGKQLDSNARFQEDIERNVRQGQLGGKEPLRFAAQDDRDIGIAVRTVRLPRPASEQD